VLLFFEKNNGCGNELSPFYHYSLLWREWWPKQKVRKSSSVRRNSGSCSFHCFQPILVDLFTVS